jgi:hypothetical protein
VDDLRQKAKEELEKQRDRERQELEKTLPINQTQASPVERSSTRLTSPEQSTKRAPAKERKDSSPVKVRTTPLENPFLCSELLLRSATLEHSEPRAHPELASHR